MKIHRLIGMALCLCGLTCCVSEFDIKVDGVSDFIVIDAVVTDYDSVQVVYICRDREKIIDPYGSKTQFYDRIENVSVHIADDNGWSADYTDVGEGEKGRVFQLKNHKFEPGRTYTMTVTVGSRIFEATETMAPSPIVDRLDFYPRESKDETLWAPILYFADSQPDVDNYYLFTDNLMYIRNWSGFRFLYLQRLSDVGLRGDMEGVRLSLGVGEGSDLLSGIRWGSSYTYELYTISKGNYDYYGVLEDQLVNDGGVYKPTPTSPITNFSGKNVQGQFIAASKYVISGRLFL